jgi:hypothetical protein
MQERQEVEQVVTDHSATEAAGHRLRLARARCRTPIRCRDAAEFAHGPAHEQALAPHAGAPRGLAWQLVQLLPLFLKIQPARVCQHFSQANRWPVQVFMSPIDMPETTSACSS